MKDSLPRLLLIADCFTQPEISMRLDQLSRTGSIDWVQLRDHKARRALFRGRGEALIQKFRKHNSRAVISVNTDIQLARHADTELHVGTRGPAVTQAREVLGPDALIGYSAHSLEEAARAAADGADYVTFSPIFPTDSKPGHPGVGVERLAELCQALEEAPVFALGGITPERVVCCREAGAYGVAVLSGILHAADPVDAARRYRQEAVCGSSEEC